MSNILRQRLEVGQSAQAEHPSTDTLAAFVEQGLKQRGRDRVLAHLAVCPTCREAVSLAASEVGAEGAKAAASARGFRLQFPLAMRWASLAAALAVAVGVGVISYQHETPFRQQALSSYVPASSKQEAVQERTNAPTHSAFGEPLATKSPNPENGKTSVAALSRAKTLGTLDRESKEPRAQTSKPETFNGVFPALYPQQQASASTDEPDKRQVGDDFFTTRRQVSSEEKSKAADDRSAFKNAAAAPGAIAGVPLTTASRPTVAPGLTQDVNANQGTGVIGSDWISSSSGSVAVGGMSRAFVPAGASIPAKSLGTSAVGGSLMKKPGSIFSGIVYWTISAAGKLQRRLRDGAVKIVEPAPGVAVRAIAAEGIEVWAGGSQPDLSAKQWQQRPVLFHSSDAGETWTRIDGPWHGPISDLTLVKPGRLTVGAADGNWTTGDAGNHWTRQ